MEHDFHRMTEKKPWHLHQTAFSLSHTVYALESELTGTKERGSFSKPVVAFGRWNFGEGVVAPARRDYIKITCSFELFVSLCKPAKELRAQRIMPFCF